MSIKNDSSREVRALVCRVGLQPLVEEHRDALETWQGIVGGFVEIIHLINGVYLVCNDSSGFDQAFNRTLPMSFRGGVALCEIYGDFALVRANEAGDFESLTEVDVRKWTKILSLSANLRLCRREAASDA